MKRRSKKKQLSSVETSSGSSADPHVAEMQDEPADLCFNNDYEDVEIQSYPLPGSAQVCTPEQLKTQNLLDKTTSLSPEGQPPAPSLHHQSTQSSHPWRIVLNSATHLESPSDSSLQHQPVPIFGQSSWKESSGGLSFFSSRSDAGDCDVPAIMQEKKETETMSGMKKRAKPVSVSLLYEDWQHETESLAAGSTRFSRFPQNQGDVSILKEPVSSRMSAIKKARKQLGTFLGFFGSQRRSSSPPPPSSPSILPSVAGPQFPERSNDRLKERKRAAEVWRRSKPASDQELRQQEKREEEANPHYTQGSRRYRISYQGPELPKDLSLPSTWQLKPNRTNRELIRSPLIHHLCQQFSAPTPECINTETQEEEGSSCGYLSVSEGTEPVLNEDPGPDQDLPEAEPRIMAELLSATKALSLSSGVHFHSTDSCWTRRTFSSVPRSLSMPSLSRMTSAGNKNPTRDASLPDMKLQSSFEEFTPDFSEDDEDDETYRFQCSCPGLYQCSVTGLVFDMEGEGEVVYRTVPWNRRLLIQHHKKPAGPLFDIKCLQQSVRQLHLPHCQIRPTAGFLAVAHVNEEGVEFITPHKITETHLVINITGFSGFGNVKDEDSPPDPVRALVLLFYKPPDDLDVTSVLNVLLLPRNIVIRDVQRTRRKLIGHERFIDASPHCKLHPGQVYTLSTAPEDDLIKVQPTETEFDEESHSSYFTSIHVILKAIMRDINLNLKEKKSSCSVWERDVCLSPSRAKTLTLLPNKKLLDIRSSFIDGTSGPVLNSLLDKLLEKKVFTDSERESAYEMQNRRDKARFVIDTVRKKGDAASSEMIEFLCEVDPFLCKHLDLK